jgi:hypothetical protein
MKRSPKFRTSYLRSFLRLFIFVEHILLYYISKLTYVLPSPIINLICFINIFYMQHILMITASQARVINIYKNLQHQTLTCNANICFNYILNILTKLIKFVVVDGNTMSTSPTSWAQTQFTVSSKYQQCNNTRCPIYPRSSILRKIC